MDHLNGGPHGDTEGATWKQIHGDIWTIPVAKNKWRSHYAVPLTKAALTLLGKTSQKS